ncbi:MAG: hypothetical protein JWN56_1849 [Sphingobacteriales bacterium]|nr:hypothetical protein [Sphingobacteriales bacterium]
MNIILKILIVLVSIIVLLLVVALFTKKEYALEREVTINKPRQEVFDYIKLLKNQANYSKWVMMDPQMKKDYNGTDGTVGFKYAWDSNNKDVGKGEQTITNITDGEKVDYSIHFIKPFAGMAAAYMTTSSVSPDQTKVKWGFSSKMAWPMNIVMWFMNFENMLGKDLETGLKNLKNVLEK